MNPKIGCKAEEEDKRLKTYEHQIFTQLSSKAEKLTGEIKTKGRSNT